ncbi:MAG TPA: iron-containing alcohol dehydrogenase [Atribacteraceae bacterium]|nr:iron-containing alcohol dehydrogenase [Atribacteraceae bacterium]
MNNFKFYNPTRVFFGKGETARVGTECRKYGKKILLTYGGGSIKKTGLYDQVISALKQEGMTIFELSGIQPNPRLSSVRRGVEICKTEGIEIILAMGGGSVLDASKIVAVGAKYDGDPWDFFTKEAVPGAMLPLGTVLTLAATGSEMNHNSVVTNDDTLQKWAVVDPAIFPTFSILDPVNTFTVPRDQTVNGSCDILAHLFEQYFHDINECPVQDRLNESLINTVIEYTPRVLDKPDDYDARATIMWCGTLALNHLLSAGVSGDWSTHNIEHELSALYDIPHGAGLAIVFPQWMKYVLDIIPGKFAQFGQRIWGLNADGKSQREQGLAAIERTKEWLKSIGAPISLKEVGIGSEKLEEMAERAVSRGPLGEMKPLSKVDVLNILKMCL